MKMLKLHLAPIRQPGLRFGCVGRFTDLMDNFFFILINTKDFVGTHCYNTSGTNFKTTFRFWLHPL